MKVKLTTIEINNFLSYQDAKFEKLKGYNVLIGKNNTGKSNLFRILRMLRDNYLNEDFSTRYLFDENPDLKSYINIKYQICPAFRKEIFSFFYKGGLQPSFRQSEDLEGHLSRTEWQDQGTAVKWLMDSKYCHFINVKISYLKQYSNLMLTEISLIHKDLGALVLFKMEIDKNQRRLVPHIFEPSMRGEPSYFIDEYFRAKATQVLNIGGHFSIRTVVGFHDNSTIKGSLPILIPILQELEANFLNAIKVIPDIRSFSADSSTKGASDTALDENGNNLVKFIHKKAAKQKYDWIREWTEELHSYISNIEELKQDIEGTNRTVLILKEPNLRMDIKLGNMGAGVLNIAHFLAFVKEMGENTILCVEEPELHLHPGLELKLKDKFLETAKSNLIFITTHSREFLHEDEDESSIYFIKKEDNLSLVNLISHEFFEEIYEELDIDIDKYKLQTSFLYNDDSLKKFIRKAMEPQRIEDDLWDLKQTLDFWNRTGKKEKKEAKIKFCDQVTSFANTNGGLIIVGITNDDPKKIVGVDNLEERVKQIKKVIRQFTIPSKDFIRCRNVLIEDITNQMNPCLIFAIKQTKEPILVRHLNGEYICKRRNNTETETASYKEILRNKETIHHDNFDFFYHLKGFIS